MSLPYFVIGVGGSAAHLAWQLCTLNVDIPEECGKKFFVSTGVPVICRAVAFQVLMSFEYPVEQ